MFSAVGKLVSYFWNEEGQVDISDEDNLSEAEDSSSTQKREFDGKVTHLFSGHGLIDNEVYFSFENVLGGVKPNISDEVRVIAIQQHVGGGWHADKVIVCENWEETDSVVQEPEKSDLPSNVIGQVTHFEGDTGHVNQYIYYDCKNCNHGDYIPQKGDWVKVNVSYEDGTRMSSTVTDIEPLREKTGEGIITGELGNHGYIDGDIFYDADVLTDGYKPRKWDAVSYTAVESEQGRSSWRAISVERSQQPQLTNLKVLHGPLQKSFTQELLADKEGIVVTETTDFGTVPVGNRRELKVWVKNTGNETKTFLRCHLAASSSQIQIKKIELCQDNGATKKCSKLVQTGENVVLDPTMSLCVSLILDASLQGQEKHLMVITFEGFKIGRYITASITDPYLSMVDKNDPYVQGQRHGYSRYRNNVERNSTPWMVPGERPTNFRNKLTVQYSNRLPKYNVPDDLKQLVLNHENLIEFAPVLLEQSETYEAYQFILPSMLGITTTRLSFSVSSCLLSQIKSHG